MFPATVGIPPTVSCAVLFNTMCTILSGFLLANTAIEPICIRHAPSPSTHHIFSFFLLIAMPSAIELLCPIEPTVRKSHSCPCPFLSRISNNSLLAFPVVLTIGSFSVTATICSRTSSRFI